ncbi:MAG: 2-phospho-L-lactate transferase [Thermomicrobiales bacterium]|nr:2-phospho-L-lactate transferase [Thermomicrobiales bacterium]MCO5220242.1 2-phospho-L-lactate transferase [Thermomicrobiales bacterium]
MARRVVALAGGVGGAKMAEGLMHASDDIELSVVVNTADDFELYGLSIAPDLDTVMYTLGGVANPATGWGIAGDTRNTLDGIGAYGVENWFLLGDRDFSTHILRTMWLKDGASLTEVTRRLSQGLGIPARIVPMSDQPVATMVRTPEGELAFQDYFVRRRQEDEVTGIRFAGIEHARATQEALDAIESADLIVFAPSNPIVSIGPLLAVAELRAALSATRTPRIAVSPIVAGKALKGPADKMLATLGHEPSALGVARILRPVLDGFVLDRQDSDLIPEIEELGLPARAMDTIMGDRDDRARLGREVIDFGWSLRTDDSAA